MRGRNRVFGGKYVSERGFTLVELLVVIGIIALLISILLPTLSKARESANRAKCLANLKSIGQAMTLYAQTNQGRLPNQNPRQTALDYDGVNVTLVEFYKAVLDSPGVFHCPSDRDDAPEDITTADPTLPNSARVSYDFYSIYWMPEFGPQVTRLKNAPVSWDWDGGSSVKTELQNHGNKGGNVLFSDGHADWQEQARWDKTNWPNPAEVNYRP
jgi:prepilin-type N-terminal cleavage/methylation domain-containing protein/prepilin-type processing-associated H-X9-DG protein